MTFPHPNVEATLAPAPRTFVDFLFYADAGQKNDTPQRAALAPLPFLKCAARNNLARSSPTARTDTSKEKHILYYDAKFYFQNERPNSAQTVESLWRAFFA
ncbi:hypothetical protein Zmor_003486 [Zophobas morio]|uniref:Uncharacterized protein n=1 Tax=Zophobas morio TaxID=2755281 RepID=A0AA38HLR2_9CUCU|nr:hypothetical protein Zmor_003486 [Zophobas morio]